MPGSSFEFPPFRLDVANQELWCGDERLPLRAKPFAVLAYLVANPARLVLRDELARNVWPDTHVGEGLLRGYVRELRSVLGDDPDAPRFIETIPRRGYRFVATVRSEDGRAADAARAAPPAPTSLVGREAELRDLEDLFAQALQGQRQLVFVTGEAGIGKTTLVDTFVRAVAARGIWTARGQCVEHFGSCEAYLPVLEALGRLGRQADGERVTAILARQAPTWLVEMPGLIADAELEAVQRRAQGATRERMLREFADAVEALTAVRPLLLVLEDLHWSDPSTLDLLSSLARRREPVRLLVLATYRSEEASGRAHPLASVKRELQVHDLCAELALRALSAEEVDEMLAARLPSELLAPRLGPSIHRATEGNPLFVVNLADYWSDRGIPPEPAARGGDGAADGWADIPDTLRQMIARQLERLPAEARSVLEAASAVGARFSTAAVSAALEEPEPRVDERCDELAGRALFLRPLGVDAVAPGTVAGRYEFLHALYRQVLYEQLPPTRRVRLHRRIGEWQEGVHGALAQEHAAELAVHFEQGHEHTRALHYLDLAAKNAMRRQACDEATALLHRALDRLSALPATTEHPRRELWLRMALGTALLMTRGYAAPEVKSAFSRAHELCRQMEDGPELAFALAGLFRFFLLRADFKLALELADQVLRLAESSEGPLLVVGHTLAGLPRLSIAEFAASRVHLERAVALYDFDQHRWLSAEHGDDPGLTSLVFLAVALWFTGYPDQALARMREAQALAERLAVPYCRAFALSFMGWVYVRRGEPELALAYCDALATLAAEQGFRFLHAEGAIFRGWALSAQGESDAGIEQIRAGIAARQAGGAEMGGAAHLALLVEALLRADRPEEGLRVVDEALASVESTGERSCEADLHRLKGDVLLQLDGRGRKAAAEEAERSLRQAIAVARRQGARSLELRAALSLARCLDRSGGRPAAQARRELRAVCDAFTEGFDTADLSAARALLDARPSPRA